MSRLVVVSANLRLDGGGAAALGRRLVTDGRDFAERRGLGFEVLHLGAPDRELGGDVRHFHGRRARLALAALRAQRDCGAMLFDHLGPARVQAWLPAAWRAPYALFLLGAEIASPLRGERRRAVRRAALRIAISEHTRRLAAGCAGTTAEVLAPALEERAADGAPDTALLARAGAGYFLIVGRMSAAERYKGHEALFQALVALPSARLVVTGDGDDRARLESRARALGLAGRVVFTGFVSEASRDALYAGCRALALPSSGEGFGLVYLEAMRAGRPCIGRRDGAAAEIVVDGETGLLVGSEVGELRASLQALGDDVLCARLGATGRRRYEASFSPARFRSALHGHLEALLAAGQRARAA